MNTSPTNGPLPRAMQKLADTGHMEMTIGGLESASHIAKENAIREAQDLIRAWVNRWLPGIVDPAQLRFSVNDNEPTLIIVSASI